MADLRVPVVWLEFQSLFYLCLFPFAPGLSKNSQRRKAIKKTKGLLGGVVFFAFGVPGTWDIPLAAGWGEARFKSKPSPIVCAAGHGVSEACPNVGASYYFLDQK